MRLPFDLDGPAQTWPRPVDAALEWWAALTGRSRALLRAAGVVVVLLAASGGLVDGRWGPPVDVVVAARDVPAGSAVTRTDLAVTQWPRDLVPAQALTSPAALADDAVADGAIAAGTPVTTRNVHHGGAAAAAPAGTALVPVPADLLPVLPVGTTVDLAVAGLDGTARVVAEAATVVAVDGTWQWLRVSRGEVGPLAGGIGDGTLVAAVVRADP